MRWYRCDIIRDGKSTGHVFYVPAVSDDQAAVLFKAMVSFVRDENGSGLRVVCTLTGETEV